jgi:hypothetical protein
MEWCTTVAYARLYAGAITNAITAGAEPGWRGMSGYCGFGGNDEHTSEIDLIVFSPGPAVLRNGG